MTLIYSAGHLTGEFTNVTDQVQASITGTLYATSCAASIAPCFTLIMHLNGGFGYSITVTGEITRPEIAGQYSTVTSFYVGGDFYSFAES